MQVSSPGTCLLGTLGLYAKGLYTVSLDLHTQIRIVGAEGAGPGDLDTCSSALADLKQTPWARTKLSASACYTPSQDSGYPPTTPAHPQANVLLSTEAGEVKWEVRGLEATVHVTECQNKAWMGWRQWPISCLL